MAEVGVLQLTIEDNSESAAQGLSSLATVLEKVQTAVENGLNLGETARQIKTFSEAVKQSLDQDVTRKLEQFSNALAGMKSTVSNAVNGIAQGAQSGVGSVKDSISDAMDRTEQTVSGVAESVSAGMTVVSGAMENSAGSTGTLTDGMVEVEASVEAATGSGHRFADALDAIRNKAKGTWSALIETRDGVNGLKGAFSAMFPTISSFVSGLGRIAKYRLIRTIIKEITSGISEGLENVYYYSKAVGTDFATSMDSAATSLNTMKNAIGASLTPVISALIPLMQTVVNWFITAINYVNQFFSLLSGSSTWTRALEVATDAYTDSASSAAAASSSVKDLLADWDELNVIQSESSSGSGGSGSGTGTDYSQMFEQVSEYADWIQDLVDGIEDTFGDVWTLVKQIAALLLTWKVSEIFSGLIGDLLSIAAGIQLGVLEFQVSTMLNNKFLDTGEDGWLIADVLQAVIGGVLMKKILSNVLAGQYAVLGIPIMLSINTAARVLTLLKRADVSALSEEAVKSNITSALEMGAVAGYLTYTSGASMGQALGGGAAAVLLTFGALTNLKATIEAAQTGEVTDETIKAEALGSIAIGASAGMIAKLLVPGVSAAEALGFGVATGAEAFLFTIGATLGIAATVEAAESGVNESVVKRALLSSLSMGVGGTILGMMIKGSLAAALGVGGWFAAGTLLTLAVAIGISASIPKNKVKWGTIDLTDADVQAFVDEKMFAVDVKTTVGVISDKIVVTDQKKKDLESKLSSTLGDFKIIKLGLANDQDYEKLRVDIIGDEESGEVGLIGKIDAFVQEAKESGKLTLQFTPELAGTTETDVSTWYSTYTTGWDKVNAYAKGKGTAIGNMLITGEKEAIIDGESVTLETLMTQLNNITSAMTKAKVNSSAYGDLTFGLGDVTEKSFKDIITIYSDYKKDLTDQYKELVNEQYALQGELVAALLEIDPNQEDEVTRKAVADYKRMGERLGQAVDEGVAEASAPGAKMLAETLQKKYSESLGKISDSFDDYYRDFYDFSFDYSDLKDASEKANDQLIEILSMSNNELAEIVSQTGISAWSVMEDDVKEKIKESLVEAFGADMADEILKIWGGKNPIEVTTSEGVVDLIDDDKAAGDVADDIVYAAEAGTKNAEEILGDDGLVVPAKVVIAPYAGDGTDMSFVYDAEVLNDPLQVEVDNVEISVTDSTIPDQLKKEIERAISDGNISIQENNMLYARYQDAYKQALESMGIKLDSNGNVLTDTSGALPTAFRYTGSAGMSDMRYANNSSYNTGGQGNTYQGMTNAEMQSNVATGVQVGNSSQNALLNQMISLLSRIASKDTTVVIKPSSTLGNTVKNSSYAWNKVTGQTV